MNENTYKTESLEWDSDYFGIKCGKIHLFNQVSKTDMKYLIDWTEKFQFITIANYNNSVSNNQLISSELNAFNVDINAQFLKKVSLLTAENIDEKNITLQKEMKENKDILGIAKKEFIYSRFINDPYLDKKKKSEVYYNWVLNSFESESKYFLNYSLENKIIGFILFSINAQTCTIELFAVDSAQQGKKIGYKLMKNLENFLYNMQITKIKVGTQLENIPAINFYMRYGFEYYTHTTVYHKWNIEEGNT